MPSQIDLLKEELLATQNKLNEVEKNFNERLENFVKYIVKMINEK